MILLSRRGSIARFLDSCSAHYAAGVSCPNDVKMRVCVVLQDWDGQGFFARPAELGYVQSNMALKRKRLLILSGPAKSGKKAIAEQVSLSLSLIHSNKLTSSTHFLFLAPLKNRIFELHSELYRDETRVICLLAVSRSSRFHVQMYSMSYLSGTRDHLQAWSTLDGTSLIWRI